MKGAKRPGSEDPKIYYEKPIITGIQYTYPYKICHADHGDAGFYVPVPDGGRRVRCEPRGRKRPFGAKYSLSCPERHNSSFYHAGHGRQRRYSPEHGGEEGAGSQREFHPHNRRRPGGRCGVHGLRAAVSGGDSPRTGRDAQPLRLLLRLSARAAGGCAACGVPDAFPDLFRDRGQASAGPCDDHHRRLCERRFRLCVHKALRHGRHWRGYRYLHGLRRPGAGRAAVFLV